MQLPVLTIRDAVERQLCAGCGACAALAPGALAMVDVPEHGQRPMPLHTWDDVPEGLSALCPGVALERPELTHDDATPSLQDAWGPGIDVFEGYASDAAVRHGGSSGGAATAIAQFALEHLDYHGVLHTAASTEEPWRNTTVMSRDAHALHERTGSRYAPASPCDGLQQIADAPRPCVFIGKPCDIAGAQKARTFNPYLDQNLGLTIGFFCAGTPTTRGALELLRSVGVEQPAHVRSLRYRGNGWPGLWAVCFVDARGIEHERTLTYEQSWGALERHRPWRCRICPDHVAEFADIAVGDAWHHGPDGEDPGRSLIITRTQRGREVVQAAIDAGYLVVTSRDPKLLERSQPELARARASVWGRLLAMRIAKIPTPDYGGFALLRTWLGLSLRDKARSLLGTFRRLGRYGLRARVDLDQYRPQPAQGTSPPRQHLKGPSTHAPVHD